MFVTRFDPTSIKHINNIDCIRWYVHNDRTHPSVRWTCAIKYFAGQLAYDVIVCNNIHRLQYMI